MKYEIMINILFDLLSKKLVSARYLADKYEVSQRTIYRYIDGLSLAGIPVITVRGASGGFKIAEGYRISFGFLTKEEHESVISALKAVFEETNNKNLESALSKFAGVKRIDGEFSMKTGNLVIDEGPWCNSGGYKDKLSLLTSATENRNALKIFYHDREGKASERIIEPHVMVFKQGMWYVYAFCRKRGEFRFFKVGRIESLDKTGEIFVRRTVPETLPFEDWYTKGDLEFVEMKIERPYVAPVGEWLGVENLYYEKDGCYAKLSLPEDDGLIAKILSFGSGVKVVKPESLVKKITAKITEINSLYL
ncbi:MAG: YafY family transcriptional regulator [Clostridia bacterium]|nr:YafY family transcriptional regulator [Clostridia bacterium]